MDLIEKYFSAEKEIKEMFGYEDSWRKLPLEDSREYYWKLWNEDVYYGPTKEDTHWESPHFAAELRYDGNTDQQHLYRTTHYTMIMIDAECDNNMFLCIFDNRKEVKL